MSESGAGGLGAEPCRNSPKGRKIAAYRGPSTPRDISRAKCRAALRMTHHTRQALAWTMGCPARQPKAWANSGILPSTLFTR